ncbi:MAG: aldehyde dehydrogenase family protein [Legionellales bacterium]|nr:aldehyde dehydrogenase family protein [Legionellales bacterium]
MSVLEMLGIKAINAGAASGVHYFQDNNTKYLSSINPSNTQVIAQVAYANETAYETIVKNAEQTFFAWRNVPAPKRGEMIRNIANALRQHKAALGTLVAMEMGKTKVEGDGEVQEMIDIADYAVGLSRMLYGKTMPSERKNHRLQEQWHPLGVVGVISAFNFPVAVWAWNAFIAAVCGNTVIWKPSHKTPLCAIAVHQICMQVMQKHGYAGVFSYYIPEKAIRDKILHDKRIPLISFTGSTAVGRMVGESIAKRLGRSILELGGNNAVIVDASADLKLAVPAIVFGAIGTAGQRCTSTRRVFIHEKVYDALIEQLQQAYQDIRIGNPLMAETLMGPLIDQSAVQLYKETLDEIKMHHGKILVGGEALLQTGYFVKPTLVELSNECPVVQRESFVPITYLMKFKTIKEAIALQNQSAHGLASAIFTQDYCHAELFLSASGSDCGLANVNIGTSGAEIGGAFGGEKDTGGGRESGSDAWKNYMRRQTATVNWGHELPLAQGINFDFGSQS